MQTIIIYPFSEISLQSYEKKSLQATDFGNSLQAKRPFRPSERNSAEKDSNKKEVFF